MITDDQRLMTKLIEKMFTNLNITLDPKKADPKQAYTVLAINEIMKGIQILQLIRPSEFNYWRKVLNEFKFIVDELEKEVNKYQDTQMNKVKDAQNN